MRQELNCQTGEVTIHEDAPLLPQPTLEEIEAEKDQLANIDNWGLQRAFALVVLDEINLLRVAVGLEPRTVDQMKTAIRSKL